MNTLQEIISTLDQQLAYAEKVSEASSEYSISETELEQVKKYVLVRMGETGVAIPITGLFEIGPLPSVTVLPNLPGWIKGIVNLRGEIVSVVDLIEFLTKKVKERGKDQRLAVLQAGKVKVGVLVDRIVATVNRPDSELTARVETENDRYDFVCKSALNLDGYSYDVLDVRSLLNLKSLRNYYEAQV